MFYLYRPPMVVGRRDEYKFERIIEGTDWVPRTLVRQTPKYEAPSSLANVCWCIPSVHLAHLLRTCWHIHPLPLIINYTGPDDFTAEDDGGIVLALKQRDRVRRIRLAVSPNLQKVAMAIDEEYPILEYLLIEKVDERTALTLLETLQAPHLRHFLLFDSILPIRSRVLTTAVGLVTLSCDDPPIHLLPAKYLLHWISFMPQLETLVDFHPLPTMMWKGNSYVRQSL
jgi:hypothetical protein